MYTIDILLNNTLVLISSFNIQNLKDVDKKFHISGFNHFHVCKIWNLGYGWHPCLPCNIISVPHMCIYNPKHDQSNIGFLWFLDDMDFQWSYQTSYDDIHCLGKCLLIYSNGHQLWFKVNVKIAKFSVARATPELKKSFHHSVCYTVKL